MFLGWDGFINRLMQMFKDPEAKVTAEWKISKLTQKGSAMEYIM